MSYVRTPEDKQRHQRLAQLTLQAMIDTLFCPDEKRRCYLFYHCKTGRGLFTFLAPCTLNQEAMAHFRSKLPFGIAEIDPRLEDLVVADGPTALRFDGTRVIADGH